MSPTETTLFELAVLGAGPGGMSAAARAAQRGLSHVLLEASGRHARTIQQYQRHKHVMAEPRLLPLRSDIEFSAGQRESILDQWQEDIRHRNVNVCYQAEATRIEGARGAFTITLKNGTVVRANNLILALGVQGNPRRLGVPGDDHPCIQPLLECADDHVDESIVVVGAGDSAIETALALAGRNRVSLINRGGDFPRAKQGNAVRIGNAIAADTLQHLSNSAIVRVESLTTEQRRRCRLTIRTPAGERQLDCDRVITRLGATPPRTFLEPIGVRFLSAAPDALPQLSPHFESTVPGLYIIGALAGFPLIKQAMNQGYDVVEHLLGNAVQPADHPILESKLQPVPFGADVDQTLNEIADRVRLFQGVSPLALRELVMASHVRAPGDGHEIFVRGEYVSTIFNVLQGKVYLHTPDAETMVIGVGQVFGALSVMAGRRSESTAVAGPDCVLLATPQGTAQKLFRSEPGAQQYMERVFILRTLRFHLLPHASVKSVHLLAAEAQVRRIAAGELLFAEGDPIDQLYLLGSGSVTLFRALEGREIALAYCATGTHVDAIGELSGQMRRNVGARANVATLAIAVSHAAFQRQLADDAVLRAQLERDRTHQLTQAMQMQSHPQAGRILSFLMQHGVGEATNVLVIDESLCIGCDQCERACAATHQGVSRLDRRAGPSYSSLHLPTSCRHCEHPHCMDDCPADAIHRQANGEIFIEDTCIGCGKCEENCPYGVIQMAAVPQPGNWLTRLLSGPAPEAAKVAVKCDMCHSVKAGPACVSACPTGAAIRIHAEEVFELARTRAVASCG